MTYAINSKHLFSKLPKTEAVTQLVLSKRDHLPSVSWPVIGGWQSLVVQAIHRPLGSCVVCDNFWWVRKVIHLGLFSYAS